MERRGTSRSSPELPMVRTADKKGRRVRFFGTKNFLRRSPSGFPGVHCRACFDLVGAAYGDCIAGTKFAKDLDQRSGSQTGLHVYPFGLAFSYPHDEGAIGRAADAAARNQ